MDMKVIAKLCEMSKSRSIVFKGIWEDTVHHDKMSLDNNFGRVMRAFVILPGDPIRSKPGCKLIRSRKRGNGIDRDSMLGIQRKSRVLWTCLGQW